MVSALMYKNMGIADAQITFWTSLVMLPWTLKPLWGPVLEMFKTKKHFVVGTQFIGGVAFGFLALTLPLEGFFRYSLALFAIIAFNGATHDIAADGVYINVLSPKLQAQFVGWQGAAYNIAKVFTQGALVFLAGQLENEHRHHQGMDDDHGGIRRDPHIAQPLPCDSSLPAGQPRE